MFTDNMKWESINIIYSVMYGIELGAFKLVLVVGEFPT